MKRALCVRCICEILEMLGEDSLRFWLLLISCLEEDNGKGRFEFCNDTLFLVCKLENVGVLISSEFGMNNEIAISLNGFKRHGNICIVCFREKKHRK